MTRPTAAALLSALSIALPWIAAPAWAQKAAATAAPAASAASAPAVTVRAEVGAALREAIDLHRDGKVAESLARIDKGLAELKTPTPVETAYLQRTRGLLLLQLERPAEAVSTLESALATGALPATELLMVEEALARGSFQSKNYKAAADWARKAAARGSTWGGLNALLTRALYLGDDFAGTARLLEDALAKNPAAVGDEDLRILASCYAKLKDEPGYARTVERLLSQHPRPEYWPDLLARVQRQPGWQPRYEIDLLRLRMKLELMQDENDYLDLAEMLAKAGQPVEASKVVEDGYAKKVLGTGKNAAEHQKLRTTLAKQAADDRQGLATARPPTVSDARSAGNALATGMALVSIGQGERGLEVIRAAIAGPLADVPHGRLQYALAQLQAGREADALVTLRALGTQEGVGMLARLWVIALEPKKTR